MNDEAAKITVEAIDHIVLNVTDGRRAVEWYRDKLGLEPLRYEEWLAGDVPFPSVRVSEGTIIDMMVTERTGENMNHVALRVTGDVDRLLAEDDVDVVSETVPRWGALGDGPSAYIRDPDGNVVELKRYPTT